MNPEFKKTFTKTYNTINKSSVKPVKKSRKGDDKGMNMFSGANFDPDFMSEPSDVSDEESEREIEITATKVKEPTKKPKAKTASSKSTADAGSTSLKGRGRGRGGKKTN